jgi:hypothetical protein
MIVSLILGCATSLVMLATAGLDPRQWRFFAKRFFSHSQIVILIGTHPEGKTAFATTSIHLPQFETTL